MNFYVTNLRNRQPRLLFTVTKSPRLGKAVGHSLGGKVIVVSHSAGV